MKRNHQEPARSHIYRELYGTEHPRKPDFRIFSGKTRMIDAGLERFMRKKNIDSGVDELLLDQWLDGIDALPPVDSWARPYPWGMHALRPDLPIWLWVALRRATNFKGPSHRDG